MYLQIDMKLSVLSIQKNLNLLWLGDSYFPSAFNSFLESLLLFKSPHCMGFIWIFTDYTTQCNVIFYYEYDEGVCGEGCRGWLPELHLHTWPQPQPRSPHQPDTAPLLLLNTPAFAEPSPPGSQCSAVHCGPRGCSGRYQLYEHLFCMFWDSN